MIKICIIQGPNLNFLGQRDPEIYGCQNLQDILDGLIQQFPRCKFSQYQSNDENQIIDAIQSLIGSEVQGLIINPGGYTHTSVSIFDALSMLKIPVVEVHISDITARESFRHHSLIHPLCYTRIIGMGVGGYAIGVERLLEYIHADQLV